MAVAIPDFQEIRMVTEGLGVVAWESRMMTAMGAIRRVGPETPKKSEGEPTTATA